MRHLHNLPAGRLARPAVLTRPTEPVIKIKLAATQLAHPHQHGHIVSLCLTVSPTHTTKGTRSGASGEKYSRLAGRVVCTIPKRRVTLRGQPDADDIADHAEHETVTGPKACRARRRPMGNRANPLISTADARLIEHRAKQFAGADCHLSGKSSGLTSSVRAVPPATGWRVIVKFCQ
jgi:hypothetical protein